MSENRRGGRGARFRGRAGDGGERPPGLVGKEIGMYYRNKSLGRQQEEERTGRIRLNPSVDIPPEVLGQVHKCLEAFEQQNQDERVCNEFREHFHHLLNVNFAEFLEEAKLKAATKMEGNTEYADAANARLISEMAKQKESEEFQKRLDMRQKLPAMHQSQEVLAAIRDNQVLLVVGSTGCGKTTQIPQMLLDEYIQANKGSECSIVCTQPRRISAISVAERVAYERNESLGKSVGYQIRLESRMPRENGSILYCTTGILLQKMQTDPLMNGLTAVILDEIHERSVETDLLMGLLKIILPHRPDLKVILMSATVSEDTFIDYFDNCHTLYINGTLFPVDVLYLEDILQETGFRMFENDVISSRKPHNRKRGTQDSQRNLEYMRMIDPYIMSTLKYRYNTTVVDTLRRYPDSEGCSNLDFLEFLIFYICERKPAGAILVFLPGYERISRLNERLKKPKFSNHLQYSRSIQVYPLHSMMPTAYQKAVFEPPPPGMRKVILSTILAETSVTIDDVVYVINTGRTKINDYDIEQNIQTLEEKWVSKANSQQRKGRAGRVQPGVCYNLFTRSRENTMHDIPIPEILRNRMESIILHLKLLHIKDPHEFLRTLINVPDERAIDHGLRLLKCIDALDENYTLTPLGLHLARLPIDPQMGKMILMSALFRCLDPVTSAAAGLSFKSPFYTPLGSEQKVDRIKRDLSNDTKSDHLLVHNVVRQYRVAREEGHDFNFCYKNFLSRATLSQIENMKKQFTDVMKNSSFLESSDCCENNSNINSHNVPLLRAVIASGLYPNLAFLRKTKQVGRRVRAIHQMSTPVDRRVNFHPTSVNYGEASFDSNYFVYFQKQRTSDVFLLDATMVFPMALLIFGDGVKQGQLSPKEPYICVADTYFFKCDKETSSVILKLRELLGVLLRKKALHPSPIEPNSRDEHLIKAIHMLLSLDDADNMDDQFPSTDDNDDNEESTAT